MFNDLPAPPWTIDEYENVQNFTGYWVPDKNGEPRPSTFKEWLTWVESNQCQFLFTDGGAFTVSTSFVGRNLNPDQIPVETFETLVTVTGRPGFLFRDSTHADAVKRHHHLVVLMTERLATKEKNPGFPHE